jgi:hypothetical protein
MLGEPERARRWAVDAFGVGRMAARHREVLERVASRGRPTAGP